MTTRYRSAQEFAVAETDTEKADSVDVTNPGANPPCVAEVHDDGIGIAEWAMLGPRSSACSENPKPNPVAVAGHSFVGRSLRWSHGRIDQALDI